MLWRTLFFSWVAMDCADCIASMHSSMVIKSLVFPSTLSFIVMKDGQTSCHVRKRQALELGGGFLKQTFMQACRTGLLVLIGVGLQLLGVSVDLILIEALAVERLVRTGLDVKGHRA